MQLVIDSITIKELEKMSEMMFENIVKAVVDIEKQVMAINSIMSVDLEFFLLDNGSLQKNL